MQFTKENYKKICDELAEQTPVFARIINEFGYPHYVTREANFATLVRLIIEQQVSLSSAKATYDRLKLLVNNDISPEKTLILSDDELKQAGISRQKIVYIRVLATAIADETLVLNHLDALSDDDARTQLMKLKGIGAWTADVYLMECLQRTDVFPIGDVALRTAMKQCLELAKDTSHEDLIARAEQFRPYRSLATMLFWHHYLSTKKMDLQALIS